MSRVGSAISVMALVLALTQMVGARESNPPTTKSPGALAGQPAVALDTSDDRLPADSFVALDSMPQMIFQSNPVYPEADLKAGRTGKVMVKALVSSQGVVRKAMIVKLEQGATDAMGKAAVEAALKSKFQAGRSKGKPVACWVTYAVSFVLSDKQSGDSTSTKGSEKPAPK